MLEPQADKIGTVNEDFAVESLAGDVFQLGNTSYRILKIEPGRVRVEDAQGAAPNIPFWLGEAPGRTRRTVVRRVAPARGSSAALAAGGVEAATRWLADDAVGLDDEAARQIVEHLRAPSVPCWARCRRSTRIVMERFFDASGGMQLVIHSPFGSRLNRAWGLALRKRFCRTFNFELQAAATEDAIVLSLSTSHSFRARRGGALPAFGLGARRAGAGAARCAAVRRALALERHHRAGAAALHAAGARWRRSCSA